MTKTMHLIFSEIKNKLINSSLDNVQVSVQYEINKTGEEQRTVYLWKNDKIIGSGYSSNSFDTAADIAISRAIEYLEQKTEVITIKEQNDE
jgi:flavin-binding protein dodecin